MKLFLIRHGNAINKSFSIGKPLSNLGIAEVQVLAQNLKNTKICVGQIFHSGKLRAEQTAEIIQSSLNSNIPLKKDPFLSPDQNIEIWKEKILFEEENTMLVGHNPYMSLLASSLCNKNIVFNTSSCVVLELDQNKKWHLIWEFHH